MAVSAFSSSSSRAFLLLEPARVVALPRDAGAAVELQDPARDVVEEVAVVRDGDDRAGVLGEVPLEPRHGLGVEVIRRLVEEQEVRLLEEDLAERDAALLAARDLRRRPRRRAEGAARPSRSRAAGRAPTRSTASIASWTRWYSAMTFSLSASESSSASFSLSSSNRLSRAARLRDALLDVAEDVLRRVEPRVLRQESDARAVGREAPRRRSPSRRRP